MNEVGMSEVKALIRFYDRRGWDWTGAVEYLCWQMRRGMNKDESNG